MSGHGEVYGHHGHGGCCQPGGLHGRPFHRHLRPREERIARLQEYLRYIQAEATAAEERLAEIKAAGWAKPAVGLEGFPVHASPCILICCLQEYVNQNEDRLVTQSLNRRRNNAG